MDHITQNFQAHFGMFSTEYTFSRLALSNFLRQLYACIYNVAKELKDQMNKRLVGRNQCCYITWENNVTIVTDNFLTENQT